MGNNGGCEHTCTDGNNEPQCSCWPGYTSTGHGDQGCVGKKELINPTYLDTKQQKALSAQIIVIV